MSAPFFDVSINDQIAHVVLNRPEKRNALSEEAWVELPKIIRNIDDEAKARVIIISARGPVFCAGIDISMLSSGFASGNDKNVPTYGAEFLEIVTYMQETFSALEAARIPVIAAIKGGCYGAGVDMITACDMRFGTQESFMTIHEINVGMTADVGTFPRILNHLPEGVVRELAYTGRKMYAPEAERRGLFNAVFDDEAEMMKAVMDMAALIAVKAPLAIYGSKRAISYGRDHSTSDALENIGIWNMSMLQPTEMMEAMAANKQNRPGRFSDLPKRRRHKS